MTTLTPLLSKSASAAAPPPITACRVHRFGSPEVITLEDIQRPEPGEGEVLVQVGAAGVGPWDAWIRTGKSALPQPLPLTLGSDLSGVVEAIGAGVTAFVPGDHVFGVTNPRFVGAYAEFAVASAGMIAKRPARLGDIEAASIPVVAVTAWQALFEQAHLGRGQSVLIHGAAGNVGAYAVQFARGAGLQVIATAGSRDLDYVRSLGAQEVIDFRAVRFDDEISAVDAVVDLVGGEAQQRSFAVLKPGGTLVSAVSPPDQATAERHGVRAMFFLVNVTTSRLNQIAAMIDAGDLATSIGTILPLADARTAHEMLDGLRPHPRGKIVLSIRG